MLKDDIRVIADDVRRVSGADVSANWQIILNTVYRHREKIPLLLKAGMGMEILRQINRSIDGVNEEYSQQAAYRNNRTAPHRAADSPPFPGIKANCIMAIDKIRVTEICRAADIERPTFYYHFKDKYDLVAWMFCTDAYGTDITSVPSAAAGMNKMKQDILFYKRAYEDSSQNALWHYMVEYFTRRYTELAKKKLGTDILDTQLAYSIRFYCMGSVGMTQEWVLTDNITSAETVVQMMFNSMPENLRKILF